jgi:WD40-like Beta Propeller Repeat
VIVRTLVAGVACAAALSAAGPAQAAFPGPNGTIAFTGVPCPLSNCPPEVMRTGPSGGTAVTLAPGSHPAWSADGQRLAFADGTDIYTAEPDGSDRQLVLDWNLDVEGISWAPSGDRLAAALGVCDQDECRVDIHVIVLGPAGAQSVVNITPDLFPDRNPAWSPGGARIAFDTAREGNNDVFTMDVDGSNLERLTTDPAADGDPNWAPSGNAIAFTSGRDGADVIYTMNADGTAQTRRTLAGRSRQPAWSPDGRLIVFSGIRGEGWMSALYAVSLEGGAESQLTSASDRNDFEPDWQPASIPAPVGYPRPKSASPLTVSLVPSYARCLAPNRTHGPPLAFGSCRPPSQESPHVTVGTPDANGAAANSAGSLRFKVCCFDDHPWLPDVVIDFTLGDVRCVVAGASCGPVNDSGGADYAGELQVLPVIRLTDKSPPPDPWVPFEPTTTQDFPFPIRAGCSATSSTATGAVCAVYTSANAVVPGSVQDDKRAIWQMDQVRVLDGGADGDADTAGDNRLFATQGVFVP